MSYFSFTVLLVLKIALGAGNRSQVRILLPRLESQGLDKTSADVFGQFFFVLKQSLTMVIGNNVID